MIKHLSLDFWNTIGIANKTFATLRSEILSEFSATVFTDGTIHRHTSEYCRAAYTAVKQEMDAKERDGHYFPTDVCYDRLVEHLEIDLPFHKMALMKARIWEAFYNCPPTILPETIAELKRLKAKGYTMSIGSNTNFIPGQIIIESVLKQLGVFDFYIFSDAIARSKPGAGFFYHVEDNAFDILGHKRDTILHIGDSKVFDYDGATNVGLAAKLIADPFELAIYLQDFDK